jgi:hypothetical protein
LTFTHVEENEDKQKDQRLVYWHSSAMADESDGTAHPGLAFKRQTICHKGARTAK